MWVEAGLNCQIWSRNTNLYSAIFAEKLKKEQGITCMIISAQIKVFGT
jgi:hypothetical protein